MTLSWPSFLAAVTSASTPPRSVALAAVAALAEFESLFFSGGEHAVSEANVVAASRATAVRAMVCTIPPSRRPTRDPTAMRWIIEGLGGGKATPRHRSGHEAVTGPGLKRHHLSPAWLIMPYARAAGRPVGRSAGRQYETPFPQGSPPRADSAV